MLHICWLIFKCFYCSLAFPTTKIHWHFGPPRRVSDLDSSLGHSGQMYICLHLVSWSAIYSIILFQLSALERPLEGLKGQGPWPSAKPAGFFLPCHKGIRPTVLVGHLAWGGLSLFQQGYCLWNQFFGLQSNGWTRDQLWAQCVPWQCSSCALEQTHMIQTTIPLYLPLHGKEMQACKPLEHITRSPATAGTGAEGKPKGASQQSHHLSLDPSWQASKMAFTCTIALPHVKQNFNLQGSRQVLRFTTEVKILILYCSTNCVREKWVLTAVSVQV